MRENRPKLSEEGKQLMKSNPAKSSDSWQDFLRELDENKKNYFENSEDASKYLETCREVILFLGDWKEFNRYKKYEIVYHPEIERYINKKDERNHFNHFEAIMLSLIMLIFFIIWLNRR